MPTILKSLFLLPILALAAPASAQFYVYKDGEAQFSSSNTIPDSVSFHAPASDPMSSDAKTLISKINVGINIGNTLEVPSSDDQNGETGWGNPLVNETYMHPLCRWIGGWHHQAACRSMAT